MEAAGRGQSKKGAWIDSAICRSSAAACLTSSAAIMAEDVKQTLDMAIEWT
jgi:hypothetical protein